MAYPSINLESSTGKGDVCVEGAVQGVATLLLHAFVPHIQGNWRLQINDTHISNTSSEWDGKLRIPEL